MIREDRKTLEELCFPKKLLYCKEHTWANIEDNQVRVGITDYAQDQLGAVIFVELPKVGDIYNAKEVFGQAESAKIVSSLYMPLSGEIIAVNNELEESPENLNKDPYGVGWIIIVKSKEFDNLSHLLSKDDYIKSLVQRQEMKIK